MAFKSTVVDLPNTLKDPTQPSSLQNGEETKVGASKIIPYPVSENIRNFWNGDGPAYQNHGRINDVRLLENMNDYSNRHMKEILFGNGKKMIDYLSKFSNLGYRISRTQWYEIYDHFQVAKGDSKTREISKIFSTSASQTNDTSRTLGVTVGSNTTVKAGAKASVSASYGSISGKAEVSAEYQHVNSKTFKDDLYMGESSSKTNSQGYTLTETDDYSGGEKGRLYVFFQIVDRFLLERIDHKTKKLINVNDDFGILSDVKVYGQIWEKNYDYK